MIFYQEIDDARAATRGAAGVSKMEAHPLVISGEYDTVARNWRWR
jgi:hypothetical protein